MLFAAKLYPKTIWGDAFDGDFNKLAKTLSELPIHSVIVPVLQGSRVFFPTESEEPQQNARWDLKGLQDACHAQNIAFIPEFPIFHDPDTYERVPQYRPVNLKGSRDFPSPWYRPICPSNEPYRNYRIQLVAEALKYFEPALISLDFLHYPYQPDVPAMAEDGTALPMYCYCDFCRYQFLDHAGRPNPLEAVEDWFAFRCENITLVPVLISEFLEKSGRQANLLVQLPAVLPPYVQEKLRRAAAQDLKQWRGLVQIVSPQLHSFQLGLSPEEMQVVLQELKTVEEIRIMPEIDLPLETDAGQKEMLIRTLKGFSDQHFEAATLFHAEMLLQRPELRSVLEKFA